MESTKKSIQQLGIKTGLVISLLLIAYFLMMKELHLVQIIEFRFLNFIIFLGGIIYAYRKYKEPNKNIEYMSGMGLGLVTTASSVIPFVLFIYVYFSFINPTLLMELKSNSVMMGQYISASSAAGTVLIEGMCSGLILSFVMMQYYKSGFNKQENKVWRSDSKKEVFE